MVDQLSGLSEIEPKFSCAIVCTPKRINMARSIKKELPFAKIVVDQTMQGSWPTHRKCCLKYDPNYSHHLVLEEDVKLSPNFIHHVNSIIESVPDDKIISLFHMQAFEKGTQICQKEDRHFFTRNGSTGQAVLFPQHVMLSWLAWCDKNIRPEVPYEDTRLCLWLTYTKQTLWVCFPNLVEHLCPTSSTLGHFFNRENHVSGMFLSEYVDDIDWTHNINRVPKTAETIIDYRVFKKKWNINL